MFDICIVGFWTHDEVALFPSDDPLDMASSKPQHKKWSFFGISPLLFPYVDPSPVHIVGTLRNPYVCCKMFMLKSLLSLISSPTLFSLSEQLVPHKMS